MYKLNMIEITLLVKTKIKIKALFDYYFDLTCKIIKKSK